MPLAWWKSRVPLTVTPELTTPLLKVPSFIFMSGAPSPSVYDRMRVAGVPEEAIAQKAAFDARPAPAPDAAVFERMRAAGVPEGAVQQAMDVAARRQGGQA